MSDPMLLNELTLEIAELLLVSNKEISVQDIMSIPFLVDKDKTETIVNILRNKYNTEVYQRSISSSGILDWEEVIRLKD